jgi:hypothetical protein
MPSRGATTLLMINGTRSAMAESRIVTPVVQVQLPSRTPPIKLSAIVNCLVHHVSAYNFSHHHASS